jgi:hypothetical protein
MFLLDVDNISFWNKFWEAIYNLPDVWQIFLIISMGLLSILIILAMVRPFIQDFFNNIKDVRDIFKVNKKTHKPEPESEYKIDKVYGMLEQHEIRDKILNHRIMFDIKEIENKATIMDFGDKDRNRIFSLILTTYADSMKNNIMKIIDVYDIDRLDTDKFRRVIHGMVSDITSETSLKLKAELGKEIYDLTMMDPGRGMRAWTKHIDDNTWKLIEEFCNISYLEFNHQKLLFILTSLSTSLTVISEGIERRFEDFNGELTCLLKKYNI